MTHRGKRSVGCTLYAIFAVLSTAATSNAKSAVSFHLTVGFVIICILAVAVFSYDEPSQKPKEVKTP